MTKSPMVGAMVVSAALLLACMDINQQVLCAMQHMSRAPFFDSLVELRDVPWNKPLLRKQNAEILHDGKELEPSCVRESHLPVP